MIDLLAALFDRHPYKILIAASYDGTITYANAPVVRQFVDYRQERPEDLTGEPLADVAEKKGLREDQAPLLRVLSDPKQRMHFNRSPDDTAWWVASAVPCSDAEIKPELIMSEHVVESRDRAIAEHQVVADRVAIALEYARCRRLQEAALAALVDANRRLDWVGGLLIDASNRRGDLVEDPALT